MRLLIMRNQSKITILPFPISPCHVYISMVLVITTDVIFDSYQASDLVKLDILLNGQPVDAMATIVHSLKAQRVGRELVDKLKKHIDR